MLRLEFTFGEFGIKLSRTGRLGRVPLVFYFLEHEHYHEPIANHSL